MIKDKTTEEIRAIFGVPETDLTEAELELIRQENAWAAENPWRRFR
jgi:Skp1 family, dimerisation domain